MDYNITLPFKEEDIKKIKNQDVLYLNGTIFSARDAAHKRIAPFKNTFSFPE